jgi:hypothetical protein
MKRTLLVLAILALGGGCHSSCDTPGTITYYWQFVGSDGHVVGNFDVDGSTTPVPNSSCFVNGVPFVDNIQITVDGTFEEVPCSGPNQVPGARLPGFLSGNHTWTIDGVRGSGANAVVLFTASGTTPAHTCNDTPVFVPLQAVSPADLVVYYDVNGKPPTGCQIGGVPITHVAYEIRNPANQIVDSSCAARTPPVTGACQSEKTASVCDPNSLGFVSTSVLPLGNYLMNYLELWQGTGLQVSPLAQICASDNGAQFVHNGFPVFLNLSVSSGQFCPANVPAAGP